MPFHIRSIALPTRIVFFFIVYHSIIACFSLLGLAMDISYHVDWYLSNTYV